MTQPTHGKAERPADWRGTLRTHGEILGNLIAPALESNGWGALRGEDVRRSRHQRDGAMHEFEPVDTLW